jgi:hypothetical protein
MSKRQPQGVEFFDGQWDYGLGFCLQCIAEYKISGENPDIFPHYACMVAPMSGMPSSAGSCYQHLNVQPPQAPPPPMRPEEAQAVQRLLMPNGQPGQPRHAR